MGRSPCCEKVGLKKGPWTPEEDQKLLSYIEEHGHGSWRALPAKAGLQRCGKSCRLRWTNYLRPDIKRGKFTLQEEQTIIQLHALLGNRWSAIATHLPKRTDNEIKNYWNTHLKKRLTKMGIDPVTHKPKSDALSSPEGPTKSAATLSHMAQWESARLEAEARLARESKLRSSSSAAAATYAHVPAAELHEAPVFVGAWPAAKPAARPPGQFGRPMPIDQESPTSTLSFSADSLSPGCLGFAADRLAPAAGRRPEPEPAGIAGGYAIDVPAMLAVDMPWLLPDPLKHAAGFADGFGDMLIEHSAEQSSSETSKAEGGGEENKSYWNSILNLVNSSSPSGSSPLF